MFKTQHDHIAARYMFTPVLPRQTTFVGNPSPSFKRLCPWVYLLYSGVESLGPVLGNDGYIQGTWDMQNSAGKYRRGTMKGNECKGNARKIQGT